MAEFLEEKRREIEGRLRELKPLVEEYGRLEAAARALDGVDGNGRTASPKRGTTRRGTAGGSRAGSRGGTGSGRRGRPKGTGSRANETLALVREHPGITIPELAERMGIKQNYLYRVLPGLQDDGQVRKEGRGWHPQQAA